MAEIKTDSQIKKVIKDSVLLEEDKKTYFSISGYQGLRLRIRGRSVDFQHRYSNPITKKRKEMTLGKYPALSLEMARQLHADNLRLLALGIDPIENRNSEITKSALAQQNTFRAIAKSWIEEQTINPYNTPSKKTLQNWQTYITPLNEQFGDLPITNISTQNILALCKEIQKTHIHKGNQVKAIANRIFAYAVIHGILDRNPVTELTVARVLKSNKPKHHPALTNPDEFGILLKEIAEVNTAKVYDKVLLQLLAYTFVRIGDLVQMRWEDIDFETKQWVFKPQKGRTRTDMVDYLVVPLAPQVIVILRKMYELTGMFEFVFYAPRRNLRYYDNKNVNKLLNSDKMNLNKLGGEEYLEGQGYRHVHCPHGFRATAKTLLMEKLKYGHLLTEIQSGRAMPDQYGNTYNRMEGIEERTRMMTVWADYLDGLRERASL